MILNTAGVHTSMKRHRKIIMLVNYIILKFQHKIILYTCAKHDI